MSPITTNKFKRLNIRYFTRIMFIIGIILLVFNVTYRLLYINRPFKINEKEITERIDYSFSQTKSFCKQWLNTSNDSLFLDRLWSVGVPKEWDDRKITLLLYKNDSLLFWSNYYFTYKVDPNKFKVKNSVVQCDSYKVVFNKYVSADKTALVLLNLWSSYTGTNQYVFNDQKVYVLNNSEYYAKDDNISYINDYIRLKPETVLVMPMYVRIMGWIGLFILTLCVKRYFRKRTTSSNSLLMTILLALTLTGFALFFNYFSLQNDTDGSKFAQYIITLDGRKFTIGNLLIIFSMILVFIIYIYNIRSKFRYAYNKIKSSIIKWILFVSVIIVINAVVVFFHYSMVNIIYNSNINLELYKLTSLSFSTLVFYIVSTFFVVSRILTNKAVRFIFSEMKSIITIPLSLVILLCMIIPIENGIYNTGYILILFQLAYLLVSVLDDKYSHDYVFIILITIFAAYILLFSSIESYNADDIKAQEYAHVIANNDDIIDYYSTDEYQKFTYYKIDRHNFDVKEDNNFELQNLTDIISYKSDTIIRRYNVVHSLFHFGNGKIVIVSRNQVSILDYLAYFSYIFFCLFILCDIILRIIGVKSKKTVRSKFAIKIKFIILGTVIMTMLMVVFVIVVNAFDNYWLTQKQVMNNHMRSLINSLNNFTSRYHGQAEHCLRDWFLNNNNALRDKYINIYNVNGDLIGSTIPANQIAIKLNTRAMSAFKEVELPLFNSEFTYNNITYNSSFIPGYIGNEKIGYINLIQRDRVNSIRTDIRYDLIVKMLNVLMVVVVIALLLSIFFYRTLAKPLNRLYEGMSNISALKKIEQSGRAKDEISLLITQYNRMIDYIEESYEALARAEREGAWRNMARQVAHEIKNPLTPMRLKVQMLQKAKAKNVENIDQQIDSTLELLLKQIDILAQIANEFSDFAKIGQTKSELVSVSKLLQSIENLYSSNEHVRFIVEIIDDNLMINVDYIQIHRVFVNLCQNAIQAIGNTQNGIVKITALKEGNRIIFTVQDNGSGISEENRKHIFNPNFTTKSTGSGLGLAMSREIILNAGGIIRFNSQIGVGTTFIIILPLALNTTEDNQNLTL